MTATKPRACVLGASGFIGRAAVGALQPHFSVRAAVRGGSDCHFSNDVELMTGVDVTDLASLERAVRGCKVVVNAAGVAKSGGFSPCQLAAGPQPLK